MGTCWSHMNDLLKEFNTLLHLDFVCPEDIFDQGIRALEFLGTAALRQKTERRKLLFSTVNSRLNLNRGRIKQFIDFAAHHGRYFNYWEKKELQDFFDSERKADFEHWCTTKRLDEELASAFFPINEKETLEGLHELLASGAVNRSDARKCSLLEKQNLIQRALFGSFVFQAFERKQIFSFLNEDVRSRYFENFFDHLRVFHADQLHRECALIHLVIDLESHSGESYDAFADEILSCIEQAYSRLANHCYLSVHIKDSGCDQARKWQLFSDALLFAEKHREEKLSKGYFRPDQIRRATREYIPELNEDEARFEIANEGFFFKDCYILSSSCQEQTNSDPYDLLLLFEKNHRDERVIPCPACRSKNVAGNSYPTLGVRSWECRNVLCPERSAYDRGNRYSLVSIIRQEAIHSEYDQIPSKVLQRWRNDVVFDVSDNEILEMLVRHFSLHRDSVIVVNQARDQQTYLGRKLIYESREDWKIRHGLRQSFYQSPFFRRFSIERESLPSALSLQAENLESGITLVHGDCETGLNTVAQNSLDGAVTSPPYYNAREYSQWPNIYCYLYDMYNSARSVYRVLKPGALYIYNIFDYFDNERILAFSAMGKKRLTLGAYIIHLFTKAGFEVADNTIWYKGDIEGKRNFNQGNTSPYYQLPFNCWEHCLVFRKPGGSKSLPQQTQILKQRPVFKMVGGKNTHGHTAPFPHGIPDLLIDQVPAGARILDPYGGSMTTICQAIKREIGALGFERDAAYYELGKKYVQQELRSTYNLFASAK